MKSFDSRLTSLKGEFDEERIFVLGNGPSLQDTPLEELADEYTLGVNKITKLFDDVDWRPSFYLAIHGEEGIEKSEFMTAINLDVPCFFPNQHTEFLPERDNVYFLNTEDIRDKYDIDTFGEYGRNVANEYDLSKIWSREIAEVVYTYTTVLYPAIQLVSWLGFDEIYLLGCDLYKEYNPHMIFPKGDNPAEYIWKHDSTLRNTVEFLGNSDHPIRTLANAATFFFMKTGLFSRLQPLLYRMFDVMGDPTHFYQDSGLQLGNQKRNERMRRSHRIIRDAANQYKFDIFNATIGGQLEIYSRVDFQSLQ